MLRPFTQKHNKALTEIAGKTVSVLPFSDDTREKRAQRIDRATGEDWDAFEFFARTYFPHVFGLPFCTAHEVMFEQVETHPGITAITGFRGLGKTVLMGVVYPLWKIVKGERYVIHTAADVDLSEERTAFTRHELTENRRLLGDFPELEVLDQDDRYFFLRNKTLIRARSIKQSHRGTINPRTATRPGLIVCDDIDKEENMGNLSIGRRRMDKIIQELGGALAPDGSGKVVWLGNLVHPNYAICQFMDAIKGELAADRPEAELSAAQVLRSRQRAILRFPLENTKGRSVWEAQYPTDTLPDLRLKFGQAGYLREMLGVPVIEGNIFKHDWFKRWNSLPLKFRRVWLYADPAWGEKGCFKAIIVTGYDGNRFYVLRVWVRRTENTRFFRYLFDAMTELDKTYGVRFRAAMEASYGQERVFADFDRWCRDEELMPLSHMIKRIYTAENKSLRIERTETVIETGKVLFPDGQDTPTLISQFLTYPDGFIDGCDAMAGCFERFTEYDTGKNRVRVRRLVF
jgi:hypothetical protein